MRVKWTKGEKEKLLQKIINSSNNICFNEIVCCAEYFGFKLGRVNGSHHIFSHPNINELLNLQNFKKNSKKVSQIIKG